MDRDGKVGEASDQQKLTRALDTVVEVLVGPKLETVRNSVTALESSLSERIESVKKDSVAAVDRAVKDVTTRLDELMRKLDEADERHKKSASDLDQRGRRTEAELRKQLQEAQTKTETRLQSLKAETGKNLSTKEEQLKKELGGVAGGLSALQLELQQQMMNTDRISTLLNGMASVLTGQPSAQPDAMQQIPHNLGSEENLESALEHAFHAEMPADKAVDVDKKAETKSGPSSSSQNFKKK
jgi:F0F1-type ATP synthase membrane subunit b/b'